MANNGDKIIAYYVVDVGSALNTVSTYFAGTKLFDFTSIGIDTYSFYIEAIRISSSEARVSTHCSGVINTYVYDLTSKNWATANVIKITATAVSGSCVGKMGIVEFKPASQ